MTDIFISYASEDRAVAASLAEQLESHGWRVWWDRELRSGVDFTREIASRLEAARCVLVLWSVSSVESHWVRDEANEGLRRGVLVPVRIDAAAPPYGFRSLQTLSLQQWLAAREPAELLRLVSDIGHLLGSTGAQARSSTMARQSTEPVRPSRKGRRFWWGSLAALTVAVVGAALFYEEVVLPERASAAARARAAEAAKMPPNEIRQEMVPLDAADAPVADRSRPSSSLGPYATRRRAEEVAVDWLNRNGGGRARVVHRGDGYYVDVLSAP